MKLLTTDVSEALLPVTVTALYTPHRDDNTIRQMTGEPDLKPFWLTICSKVSSYPEARR
jgi:hypothetical protein